jgi:hypothetical protein
MKARVKKLEQIKYKKSNKELPLFLDVEGDTILFNDGLLRDIGINPEDYPKYTGEPLDVILEGRKIPKKAPFISHYTGETFALNCYLHLKGYEDKRIILL